MELKRKHRYLLSILTGLILGLSFPYIGSAAPLAFVALIPLLIIEEQVYSKRYRSGKVFLHAYIAFFFYNLTATWWIYFASSGGVLMAVLANSLLMVLPFYFFHWTKKKVGVKEGYISLVFYWLAFEYLHYYWELSWPWLSFGNVFANWTSMIQWYEWTGVTGGTLWILVSNIFLFHIIKKAWIYREGWKTHLKKLYLWAALIVLPWLVSTIMYVRYEDDPKGKGLNVVSIQPNVDPYKKFNKIEPIDQIQTIIDLGKKQVDEEVDLILAPETAIPFSINESELEASWLVQPLIEWVNEMNGPTLVIGASTHKVFEEKQSPASRPMKNDQGFFESYNTALVIAPGEPITTYHKSKLVLGVEHLPFAKYLGFLEDFALDLGGTVGSLGIEKSPKVFAHNDIPFASLICYESVYGEFITRFVRKGAQAIFIITNDGWWEDTPGYKQHMAFSRLRAIENRRYVVRSANTGISCFINPRGDVSQATGWWVEDVIKGKIQPKTEMTIYSTYGDFLGRSSLLVAGLLLLYAIIKSLRQFGVSTPMTTEDTNSK